MKNYSLELPPDFEEYEYEVTAKGWFPDASIEFDGKRYRINIYDAVRLKQEVQDELDNSGMFLEPNLLVLPAVTREQMELAVERLVESGRIRSFVPE